LGPAGGVVLSVGPVVGPAVVPVAVRFTPAVLEAVVAPRFFVKYQIAAATIARRIKIHNQLTPPLSVAGGGVVGAGVTVVWAEATEEINRKARAETRFIGLSSGAVTQANTPSSKRFPHRGDCSTRFALSVSQGECHLYGSWISAPPSHF
jgi:hypothetical protein